MNQPWPHSGVIPLKVEVSFDPVSILQVLWDELPTLTRGLDTPMTGFPPTPPPWAIDGMDSRISPCPGVPFTKAASPELGRGVDLLRGLTAGVGPRGDGDQEGRMLQPQARGLLRG